VFGVTAKLDFLLPFTQKHRQKENTYRYVLNMFKKFCVGRPAKQTDETNIDWFPTLHMGIKSESKISSCLDRYERARRQNDARLQQEESAMSFQQIEIVCAKMISKIANEILEDIA